jgi:hypothetical protein
MQRSSLRAKHPSWRAAPVMASEASVIASDARQSPITSHTSPDHHAALAMTGGGIVMAREAPVMASAAPVMASEVPVIASEARQSPVTSHTSPDHHAALAMTAPRACITTAWGLAPTGWPAGLFGLGCFSPLFRCLPRGCAPDDLPRSSTAALSPCKQPPQRSARTTALFQPSASGWARHEDGLGF